MKKIEMDEYGIPNYDDFPMFDQVGVRRSWMPPYPATISHLSKDEKVHVTTHSRSPTWALGAVYVSEEEYNELHSK